MKAIIDLHCHTISSGHAYSTIKENIDIAKEKHLKFLGISDHAVTMPGGPHIFHFNNLRVIPKEVQGIRILKGIEANIMDFNGNIDVPKEVLESLDYVIASLHPPCIEFGTKEENTNAVIKAMENPHIKIIGHPDDNRYPLDYEKVVRAAKENSVLLEVNNSSLRPNGYREGAWDNAKTMLELCKEYKVKVIFNSDAHICYDVGEFSNCLKLIKEIDFPESLVINFNENDIETKILKNNRV